MLPIVQPFRKNCTHIFMSWNNLFNGQMKSWPCRKPRRRQHWMPQPKGSTAFTAASQGVDSVDCQQAKASTALTVASQGVDSVNLLFQECSRAVFRARYCSSCTLRSFFPFRKITWSVMLMTQLWWLLCHPQALVTVAESLIRDLGWVSEWCDLWGMKLNASKTKTLIVFRSRTMHPQSPPLTIIGTVLKKSDDLVILGVTFD